MEVQINLAGVRRLLILIIGPVIALGLAVQIFEFVLDNPFQSAWSEFFSLSEEKNLPTWISSLFLAFGSVLLGLIAVASQQLKRRYIYHWWVLALAFAYISLDEFVEIHEKINGLFILSGVFYFAWVIPAAVIVGLIGVSYIGFLSHLQKMIRYRFILSGALYVGGALGVELILGYWADLHGNDNFIYFIIDFVQESMEIMGMTLFLYTLLQYLAGERGVITVRLISASQPNSKA